MDAGRGAEARAPASVFAAGLFAPPPRRSFHVTTFRLAGAAGTVPRVLRSGPVSGGCPSSVMAPQLESPDIFRGSSSATAESSSLQASEALPGEPDVVLASEGA